MIKNLISIILRVGMILLSLGIVSSHANAQEKYKYVLEENEDKELCEHMTQVFNHNFQTPWDIGTLNPVAKYPKHFEKPYDQIFERLSGVKFNQDFTYSMLLAKYPSSPEFDEILWKEGRLDSPGLSSSDHVMKPTLITEIDLYNNGTKEWVVNQPMGQMRRSEGMYHGTLSDEGTLTIFPLDALDPNLPLTLDQLIHGQKPNQQPRKLDSVVALQIRPLIYKGNTYLSAYKQIWPERAYVENPQGKPYQTYPDREYMNILRAVPGGKLIGHEIIETANTEVVCHIRMYMLHNTPSLKGK